MRYSIRMKLTFLLVFLTAVTIWASWGINKTMVVDYYMANEKKSLVDTYKELDELYSNYKDYTYQELIGDGNYELETEQITSNANVTAMIRAISIRGELLPVYPQNETVSKMQESMFKLLKLIYGGTNDDESSSEIHTKGYTIQKNSDRQLKGEYMDLYGILGDSFLVVLRTPLESIRDSAAVSSRLFAYISFFMVVIGSLAMFYVSKRFAVPIQQMAQVAKRMSNLDFDARVLINSQDEIGELGTCINELSDKLELTISELKTANNELRKDIDKKTQIDEMRKEFLSHVSHELKTPIALIQGYAEGLKDNITDDEESRNFYCDVIADEAHKMNTMVKKLLTLNQIEFGNQQVQMERFDVVSLLHNLVDASAILYQKAGAKIEFCQKEPIWVWADEFMIEEVLSNYLSNALHHLSDNGTITIRFEQRTNEVRVFIKNTGQHIPEEDIDKLWIKFYKVDKARTREYGGSGIGLSIVSATMKAHGKAYGVENVEDGVEFYIDLDTKLISS